MKSTLLGWNIYIYLAFGVLQRKSEEVLAHHHSQVQHKATDNMVEWSVFRSQCLEVLKSQAECDVVLKQLELDHKLLITKDKEGNTVCRQLC